MRDNSARTRFLTGRLRFQFHAIRAENVEGRLGQVHLLFNSGQAPETAEFGFKLVQGQEPELGFIPPTKPIKKSYLIIG